MVVVVVYGEMMSGYYYYYTTVLTIMNVFRYFTRSHFTTNTTNPIRIPTITNHLIACIYISRCYVLRSIWNNDEWILRLILTVKPRYCIRMWGGPAKIKNISRYSYKKVCNAAKLIPAGLRSIFLYTRIFLYQVLLL
jgi:hypothetical protein